MAKKKKTYEDGLIAELTSKFKAKNLSATASYIWESANIKNWISTGDFMLDLILSNKLDGGIPVGRLTEISGGEGAGKTLLGSYLLADTQKQGGIGIFIDTEHATSLDVLAKVGVNIQKLIRVDAGSTEEVFQAIETIIEKVRKDGDNKLVTIVWDSVASTSPKAEIEGDFEANRTVALQARLISLGLRKLIPMIARHNICLVFINQLRTNIGVTFGDNKITPGGKAIPYHASIRLRLTHYKQIKDKDKDLIGRIVKCDVKKNKVAPPMRSVYYTIRWGDEPGAWIDPGETMWESAIRKEIFEKITAQKYSFTTSSGEKLEFTRKAFNTLVNDENFLQELKLALAASYIITSKNVTSEDITYEDSGEDG